MSNYLCYIEGNFAYFTDNLDEQWGDDWNDVPYEHNAESPYTHNRSIVKIAFDCDLSTPAEIAGLNSDFSVQDINQKKAPWLSGASMGTGGYIEIHAGITVEEFIETIMSIGGEVFLKLTNE